MSRLSDSTVSEMLVLSSELLQQLHLAVWLSGVPLGYISSTNIIDIPRTLPKNFYSRQNKKIFIFQAVSWWMPQPLQRQTSRMSSTRWSLLFENWHKTDFFFPFCIWRDLKADYFSESGLFYCCVLGIGFFSRLNGQFLNADIIQSHFLRADSYFAEFFCRRSSELIIFKQVFWSKILFFV